jgi:hypothetical protein
MSGLGLRGGHIVDSSLVARPACRLNMARVAVSRVRSDLCHAAEKLNSTFQKS